MRRAASEVPFYRDWFDRVGFDSRSDFSFDDFAKLPVLEREDVLEAGNSMRSTCVPARDVREDSTGGSTGVPTRIWTGPEERGWSQSGTNFFMSQLDVPAGSRTALLWLHHLDPVANDSLADRARNFIWNREWLDCARLSDELLQRYHAQLQRSRPECVIAYAGALASLADVVARLGDAPHYPTRCSVTGAEKLWPEQRRLVEETFGKPVHERYGSRDIGLMGFQLAPHANLDFAVDWAAILLEPEVRAEDSPILVTKLHADAMPLIRYRVGDRARFPVDAAPGHPVFHFAEVLGRQVDVLWLPDGRWIHGIAVPHLMKDHAIREFQMYQHEDYSIELLVVPRNHLSMDDEERVLAVLRANAPGLPVTIRVVSQIERTASQKWRPVRSAVRRTAPAGRFRGPNA